MTSNSDARSILSHGRGYILFSYPGSNMFQLSGLALSPGPSDLFIAGFDTRKYPVMHFGFEESVKIEADELRSIDTQPSSPDLPYSPNHVASREEHLQLVEKALADIDVGKLEKVVCSRVSLIGDVSPGDLFTALHRLRSAHPAAFVFLISTPQTGCWIGASPELLLSRNAGDGKTMALAGTLSAEGDERWSDKEYREQAVVTEYIVDQLESAGCSRVHTEGPSELEAGKVKHLCTHITFEGGPDTIDLALALHPTPAVSGLGVRDAIDFIREHEAHDRELYSGFIGIRESRDVEHVYVNLRCGKFVRSTVEVYTGGGIVAGSDPEKEWEETERKATTLRRAFEKL